MEGNPNPKQQFPTDNYNPPWLTRLADTRGGGEGADDPPFCKRGMKSIL